MLYPSCVETSTHLFVHSQLALTVWGFLSKSFPHSGQPSTIPELFNIWLENTPMSTQWGFVKAAAFLTSLREIWLHRNSIIHDKTKLSPTTVFKSTLTTLSYIHHSFFPASHSKSSNFLSLLNLPFKHPPNITPNG